MTSIVGKNCSPRVAGGLLAALALFTAGCYKATGGGWIPSARGADKASFGFTAMCRTVTQSDGPSAALYDGQLEWQDGPVRFHGNVEPFDFVILPGRCQDVRQMLAQRGGPMQFGGTYRPQTGGASGFFTVTVIDNGTPGANGDFIQIELSGGQHAGYFNAGVLQGGNIQVF